jgi:hypothetical protein
MLPDAACRVPHRATLDMDVVRTSAAWRCVLEQLGVA